MRSEGDHKAIWILFAVFALFARVHGLLAIGTSDQISDISALASKRAAYYQKYEPLQASAVGTNPFPDSLLDTNRSAATTNVGSLSLRTSARTTYKIFKAQSLAPRYPAPRGMNPIMTPGFARSGPGCLSKASIAKYGGNPNNAYQDQSAAFIKASSKSNLIYLPLKNGGGDTVYRIKKSISVSKPVYVSCGAMILVDAGCTLTMTAPIKSWCYTRPVFIGTGSVVLKGGATGWVQPSWFKRTSDSYTLQKTFNSCGDHCTVILHRRQYLSSSVYINHKAGIFATAKAEISPAGRDQSSDGFVLRAGARSRSLVFSNLYRLRKGVIVPGGVTGANIFVGAFYKLTEGLSFLPKPGSPISNVQLSHNSVCIDTDSCITVTTSTSKPGLMKNVVLRSNFLLQIRGSGIKFAGTPPILDNVMAVFQAVDPTPALPSFCILRNMKSANVKGFKLFSEVWNGGWASSGSSPQLASGKFHQLTMGVTLASSLNPRRMFNIAGSSNRIVLGSMIGSAGALYVPTAKPSTIGTFWRGNPGSEMVIYGKITTGTRWRTGESRIFYLYTSLASIQLKIWPLPNRPPSYGLIITKILNEHYKKPYQVAITIKNGGLHSVNARTDFYFGIQFGPNY